jgi:cell division protein FtsW (lipid II flippase)
MKKLFLSLTGFCLLFFSAIAQDTDENSQEFKIGYWIGKNIIWIVLGIVVLIVIIRMARKKK